MFYTTFAEANVQVPMRNHTVMPIVFLLFYCCCRHRRRRRHVAAVTLLGAFCVFPVSGSTVRPKNKTVKMNGRETNPHGFALSARIVSHGKAVVHSRV